MPLPANALHFLYGPVIALLAVLVLGALLRWTFSENHVVTDQDGPVDHGLLVPVARTASRAAAGELTRRLLEVGVRATVAGSGDGGFEVLVFPRDEPTAREALPGAARD